MGLSRFGARMFCTRVVSVYPIVASLISGSIPYVRFPSLGVSRPAGAGLLLRMHPSPRRAVRRFPYARAASELLRSAAFAPFEPLLQALHRVEASIKHGLLAVLSESGSIGFSGRRSEKNGSELTGGL